MPRSKTYLAILCVAASLSACTGLGGTFVIDRFLNKEITGDTHDACMARSYQAWARHKAWVQKNYAGAVELAERASAVNKASPLSGSSFLTLICDEGRDGRLQARVDRFFEISRSDPTKECACANALVEIERWSCSRPADDKATLRRRFDTQAAACEGR